MAVVESLITGKNNVVRGADLRVIAKGKPVRISRLVQKSYPIEVKVSLKGMTKLSGGFNVKGIHLLDATQAELLL